jgi:hypothetical protein
MSTDLLAAFAAALGFAVIAPGCGSTGTGTGTPAVATDGGGAVSTDAALPGDSGVNGTEAGAEAGGPSTTVTIQPPSATVLPNATQAFTCTVTTSADSSCTWSVKEGTAGGTVTSAGLYTAPATSGSYHVVATSHASPGVSASALVTVNPPATGQVGVWTPMLGWPLATQPISGDALVRDPVRPGDFYFFYEVGTPNGGGATHVLESTDYGATWTQVDTSSFMGNPWGVAIDPNPGRDPGQPPTMYSPAGYGQGGVWKSTDGGATWVDLFHDGTGVVPTPGGGTTTFPPDKNGAHTDFYQVHILPDDPPNHILVTYHYGTPGAQALGESTDGGATWVVHNVPWGDSHYVYAIDPQTWVLISGWGGPGTYRTTTAGRLNGTISQSAWTQVSTFTHQHGSFTPWFDAANGDLYFPGNGVFPIQGVQKSHDGGATWASIYSASGVGALVATKKTLYATDLGGGVLSAPLTATSTLAAAMPPVTLAWGGPPPYGAASSFDGQHSIVVVASYAVSVNNGPVTANGDVWRYIEP